MSKLTFRETVYIDVDDDDDEADAGPSRRQRRRLSEGSVGNESAGDDGDGAVDAFSLRGVKGPSKRASRKAAASQALESLAAADARSADSGDAADAEVGEVGDAGDAGDASAAKKARRRLKRQEKRAREKRGQGEDEVEVVDLVDEPESTPKKRPRSTPVASNSSSNSSSRSCTAGRPLSSFLGKFLSQRREVSETAAPEIEVSNDEFLRLFSDTYQDGGIETGHSSDEDDEEEEEEASLPRPVDSALLGAGLRTEPCTPNGHWVEAVEAEADAGAAAVELQLFNLPYTATDAQVRAFGAELGFRFSGVDLGVTKENRPSGSCRVVLDAQSPWMRRWREEAEEREEDSDEDGGGGGGGDAEALAAACVSALQGESFGGRALKVAKQGNKKRRQSGDTRYFNDDIGCKCHNCGQVGHKQGDCPRPELSLPCHLCAGTDHVAASCPNITCYRCGQFGHHSRDCHGARTAKLKLCGHCGMPGHEARHCPSEGARMAFPLVTGGLIRCMSCNRMGHAMCAALPVPSTASVYCPNCGLLGHHVDYPGVTGEAGAGKKRKSTGGGGGGGMGRADDAQFCGTCMEPRHDAFVRMPNLLVNLSELDRQGATNSRVLALFREMTRHSSLNDLELFPALVGGASVGSGADRRLSGGSGGGGGGGGWGGGPRQGSHAPQLNLPNGGSGQGRSVSVGRGLLVGRESVPEARPSRFSSDRGSRAPPPPPPPPPRGRPMHEAASRSVAMGFGGMGGSGGGGGGFDRGGNARGHRSSYPPPYPQYAPPYAPPPQNGYQQAPSGGRSVQQEQPRVNPHKRRFQS